MHSKSVTEIQTNIQIICSNFFIFIFCWEICRERLGKGYYKGSCLHQSKYINIVYFIEEIHNNTIFP
jgi:hypothetical protein